MSIFENRRLDLKKYSYITFMGYFGEMEQNGWAAVYIIYIIQHEQKSC